MLGRHAIGKCRDLLPATVCFSVGSKQETCLNDARLEPTEMKISRVHSHLNGQEWILVHQPKVWREIEEVVARIDARRCMTKVSREKTMPGKLLYSPAAINERFKSELKSRGWGEVRTDYWVTDDFELIRKTIALSPREQKEMIEGEKRRAIRSYNVTDFQKDRIAIEVQLGKYSFISYDLFVKHMAFYVGNKIDVGVEILPMKGMQENMSSGPGYYEGALYDIARQGRGVPAVPLVLVGLEP